MHSCPAYRSLVEFSTLNHVELAIKGDIHIGIDWICMVLYDAVSYIVRDMVYITRTHDEKFWTNWSFS